MHRRTALLLISLVILSALAAGASPVFQRVFLPFMFKNATGEHREMGTLEGHVRIGPLCPVEPCPSPTPDVYSSRKILLDSNSGGTWSIPLGPDGSFKASVPAATYTVDLSDCSFLGCKRALPQMVTIEPGGVTTLEIEIDTGIR